MEHLPENNSKRVIQRPTRLGLSVYELLLEKLISREIAPGGRISVDNLVREFEVSQTPIRDALSQLEAHGLVVKTHHVGFHAAPAFTPKEFEDLYEFRRLVEPVSAAKAAENVTDDTASSFNEYNLRMEEAKDRSNPHTFNRFAKTDVMFHTIVAKNSNNRFFFDTISASNLQFHLFRQGYNPHWVGEVIAEHDEVVERIIAGDVEGARGTMLKHIDNSHKRYKSTMIVER